MSTTAATPAPADQRSSSNATAAMWLGIVGLIFFTPIPGIIALVLARKVERGAKRTAAIVLGWVQIAELIFAVLSLAIVLGAANHAVTQAGSSPSNSIPNSGSTSPRAAGTDEYNSPTSHLEAQIASGSSFDENMVATAASCQPTQIDTQGTGIYSCFITFANGETFDYLAHYVVPDQHWNAVPKSESAPQWGTAARALEDRVSQPSAVNSGQTPSATQCTPAHVDFVGTGTYTCVLTFAEGTFAYTVTWDSLWQTWQVKPR